MNRTTTQAETISATLKGLKHPQAANRMKALKDLSRYQVPSSEAIRHLLTASDDPEATVRELAVQSLAGYGVEALPTLVKLLHHDDKYIRRNAVWSIGKLGPSASSACITLCQLLRDNDPRTASAAAQTLGGMKSSTAIPALIEAMRGTNVVLCRLAAKALSQIGTPALSSLVAHLKHHDPFVRGEAALAIGWIGMPAMEAAPALLQMVETGTKKSTTSNKGVDAVTPLAPQQSGDAPDYEILARVNAVQALGRIGVTSQRVLDLLTQIARDPKDPAKSAAETSLRQIARPVEFG